MRKAFLLSLSVCFIFLSCYCAHLTYKAWAIADGWITFVGVINVVISALWATVFWKKA